ncbi:MAG: nucleotide sugar dehydrogenase [Ancrocorticia sp.]|uniref:nucleotide sugar dehydrogenase n=1 Tax=Ancrocorticia sp. TaxID=2593684 RepID=UPI003F90FACD
MTLINVVGLGYIGLPTALMLAAAGHRVVGTDSQPEVVARLASGQVTFEEDGLAGLFGQAVSSGVEFSSHYVPADLYIIAVPTPYDKETKRVDTSYVVQAVRSVMEVCPEPATVIIESTVAPGTIDQFVRPLIGSRDIRVAHAPERIIPGRMIYELVHNSRIVGADTEETAQDVKALYASFCEGDIATTDIPTAELAKVAENTYRDINIAYANELTRICHAAGLDVYELIRMANMHPRVNILQPGPGVGGHCIPVDPWFLVGDFPDTVHVVSAARDVNDSQPSWVLERVRELMAAHRISGFSRVGFYGLAYKENVDDTRESPTLQLLAALGDESRLVSTYDPHVKHTVAPHQAANLPEFLENVDMVVIMVAHDEIRENLDLLGTKLVLDTRAVCGSGPHVVHL